MQGHDRLRAVALEWARKADGDLVAASQVIKLGKRAPTDAVCFHEQQCVEKYLKALLVLRAIDFPRTHDIERLIGMLPQSLRPRLTSIEQANFTEYATAARYPGWSEIPVTEARPAISMARRVRSGARKVLLPREGRRRPS